MSMPSFPGIYPHTRLRRLRQNAWIRDCVADVSLSASDLVWPVFIRTHDADPHIPTLPGIQRYNLDEIPYAIEDALTWGIRSYALFPCTPASLKTADGQEALNPNNLVCQATRKLRQHFGREIGLIADIALDPYTTHGHDGVIAPDNTCIDNDRTIGILAQKACMYADVGIDCVAPSDMMDGRVGAIRTSLDEAGFIDTLILSYAAKYATSFYGPFRHAVGAGALTDHPNPELHHKKTYQMDFRRTHEALIEVAQDLTEGADMIMVKPATLHLDTIHHIRTTFQRPTFAYHVSGEYACLKCADQAGILSYEDALIETLISLKRAGCHGIFSYGAVDAARILKR